MKKLFRFSRLLLLICIVSLVVGATFSAIGADGAYYYNASQNNGVALKDDGLASQNNTVVSKAVSQNNTAASKDDRIATQNDNAQEIPTTIHQEKDNNDISYMPYSGYSDDLTPKPVEQGQQIQVLSRNRNHYDLFIPSGQKNDISKEQKVYIGGTPIGIVAKGNALVVTQFVSVITDNGAYSPALKAGLQRGDIVIKANGQTTHDIYQLNNIVANSNGDVVLEINRNGEIFTVSIMPVYDLTQNAKKIGLQVKGDLSGIGTLTYITEDNYYGALGHKITDEFNYSDLYQSGKIFPCTLEGYIKGEQGKAGELKGTIVFDKQSMGNINKNCISGLFGKINATEKAERQSYKVGNRNIVKPGRAQIYTSIDQNPPQFYDIEIVKTQKQDSIADKSMVIRVTDKKLLQQTGGILQGMSGSPIIQDGYLVGAVTHVFISDPTMGYGIYIDWMMSS